MHDNGNTKSIVALSVKHCTAELDVYEEIWSMLETLWGFCKQQHAVRVIDFVVLQQGQPVYLHHNDLEMLKTCCLAHSVLWVNTLYAVSTLLLFFFINFFCVWHRDHEYTAPCSRFVMHIKSQIQITFFSSFSQNVHSIG